MASAQTSASNLLDILVGLAAIWGAVTGTVALMKDRAKIIVKSTVCDRYNIATKEVETDVLNITAYNAGKVPVRLVSVGFKAPKKGSLKSFVFSPELVGESSGLPITLNPGDQTQIMAPKCYKYKNEGFYEPYDMAFYVDAIGKYHYAKVPLLRHLRRWFWWTFGK